MGVKVNQHYQEVKESYLFAEIAKRIRTWQEKNGDKADKLIRMGIGDVTRPLPREVVKVLKEASDEMGVAESFHGYGPEQGYDFLREEIQKYYKNFSVHLEKEEIFISDGRGDGGGWHSGGGGGWHGGGGGGGFSGGGGSFGGGGASGGW